MAKFRFAPIVTFTAPVRVVTPAGEEQEFTGQFVYLDDKAWAQKSQVSVAEFLRDHWTGWSGIGGGEGDTEIPFSVDQRDLFLGHSYISNAVLAAYTNARVGQRAKN